MNKSFYYYYYIIISIWLISPWGLTALYVIKKLNLDNAWANNNFSSLKYKYNINWKKNGASKSLNLINEHLKKNSDLCGRIPLLQLYEHLGGADPSCVEHGTDLDGVKGASSVSFRLVLPHSLVTRKPQRKTLIQTFASILNKFKKYQLNVLKSNINNSCSRTQWDLILQDADT